MRLFAFILFSGIALTSIGACAPVPGDIGAPRQASVNSSNCPALEGYPDCHPWTAASSNLLIRGY